MGADNLCDIESAELVLATWAREYDCRTFVAWRHEPHFPTSMEAIELPVYRAQIVDGGKQCRDHKNRPMQSWRCYE